MPPFKDIAGPVVALLGVVSTLLIWALTQLSTIRRARRDDATKADDKAATVAAKNVEDAAAVRIAQLEGQRDPDLVRALFDRVKTIEERYTAASESMELRHSAALDEIRRQANEDRSQSMSQERRCQQELAEVKAISKSNQNKVEELESIVTEMEGQIKHYKQLIGEPPAL